MKNEIAVAHLLYSFGKGGMENGVVKLINGTLDKSIRHIVISFTKDISISNRVKGSNFEVYVVSHENTFTRLWYLLKLIRKEKISLIHARGWPTMMEAALLRLMIPKIRAIFSFHGRSHQELSGIGIRRKYAQIVLSRFFDQIITLTESMKLEIINDFRISGKKIEIISNGVHFENFSQGIRKNIRRQLNISQDDLVIGFVGRLDPVKNIPTLIAAFDLLSRKPGEYWLVIVGGGDEEQRLRSEAFRGPCADRILFTGFVENVQDYMHAFDIYAQSSLYEGLSNTILEAMSLGLPVVCSRVGGNVDIVKDGETGFLFDCYDYKNLSKIFYDLLSNPELRYKIKENCENIILNDYSIENMVAAYTSFYEKNHNKLIWR